MNTRLIFIFVYVKISLIGSICGQQIIIFNPSNDNLLLNPATNNTAAFSSASPSLSFNLRSRTGVLSDVKDVYFDAATPLKDDHIIGVQAYSEQETPLFTKSKAAIQYAYRQKINNTLDITLGTSIGLASMSFKSTGAGIGGSDNVFDMAVSGHVTHNKNSRFGISLMQLSSPTIQPLAYKFELARYLDAFLSHFWNLTAKWKLEAGINAKFNGNFLLWSIHTKTSYNDRFGLLLSSGRITTFAVGAYANVYEFNKHQVSIAGSFTNAYYANIPNSSAFQLNVSVH